MPTASSVTFRVRLCSPSLKLPRLPPGIVGKSASLSLFCFFSWAIWLGQNEGGEKLRGRVDSLLSIHLFIYPTTPTCPIRMMAPSRIEGVFPRSSRFLTYCSIMISSKVSQRDRDSKWKTLLWNRLVLTRWFMELSSGRKPRRTELLHYPICKCTSCDL